MTLRAPKLHHAVMKSSSRGSLKSWRRNPSSLTGIDLDDLTFFVPDGLPWQDPRGDEALKADLSKVYEAFVDGQHEFAVLQRRESAQTVRLRAEIVLRLAWLGGLYFGLLAAATRQVGGPEQVRAYAVERAEKMQATFREKMDASDENRLLWIAVAPISYEALGSREMIPSVNITMEEHDRIHIARVLNILWEHVSVARPLSPKVVREVDPVSVAVVEFDAQGAPYALWARIFYEAGRDAAPDRAGPGSWRDALEVFEAQLERDHMFVPAYMARVVGPSAFQAGYKIGRPRSPDRWDDDL